MSVKSLSKKILLLIFFILFFLLIVFTFLPTLLETQITKRVSQALELEDFQISIKKLGLFNTNIGKIKTGQSIEIDSIDIDYSLKTLIRKKIEKIQISGLTIQANVDEKFQVTLDDYDINESDTNSQKSADTDFTSLPFLPEKIELKNSKIIFNLISEQGSKQGPQHGSDQIIIPFEVTSLIKKEKKTIVANIILMLPGEKIKIHAALDLEKGITNIRIDSKSLDLSNLSQMIKPFASDIKLPDNLRLDIRTDLLIVKEKLKVHGRLAIDSPFVSPVTIKYKSGLDIKNFDLFTFEAENQLSDIIKISQNNQDIILSKPSFKISLKGAPLKAKGNFVLKSAKAATIFEDKNISAKKLAIKSDFNYDFTQKGKGISIAVNAWLKQITAKTPEHKIKITGINARIPFSIPYKAKKRPAAGKFKIDQCILDDNYKLKVNGDIVQIKAGFSIKGDVITPDIKDFKLGFGVKTIMSPQNNINIKLDFQSKPFSFSSDNLAKFIPEQAQGIDFNMVLSSNGAIEHSSKGIKSNLKIDISDGIIKIPESELTIKGLATSLEFIDLLTLRSKPAQVLNIESIAVNDIIMDKAIIKYNIESMDSLLIESTRIKWCNGIVSSEALRLPAKDNNYSIILYCDRLELTDILGQIGAFHAEGDGTMSGRIPVTYSNGEIAFDNGFLFSTPGQGGKIIIDKADKLTAGIPMDTPQFSQLDLAKEALKNYDYKWAKLNFNTFEDTLFVKMQFDGQPSKKVLPFEYKRELGRFVRVDASNPGSHFQGIKLDINLKLPFNQVMKFGNKIKKAFN